MSRSRLLSSASVLGPQIRVLLSEAPSTAASGTAR